MKAYLEYKDSGVEWIGEIPEHWNFSKLHWLAKIYSGGTPDKNNSDYWKNGTIPWLNSGTVNQSIITEYSKLITQEGFDSSSAKWIEPKDLVIALAGQGKTKGMVGFVTFKTTCNQSLGVISPHEKIDSKYLFWLLKKDYKNIRGLAGDGKRDGLNLEMIGSIPTIIPPIHEQTSIANFLDHKTAQIDESISKRKQLIELLQEQRKAIINEAVTKGINPNVKKKDSGIEWIGEIPEHWEIWKISRAFQNISSGTTPKSGEPIYHNNGTINWINTGDLNDGILYSCKKKITSKALEDYSALKVHPSNSLIVAMYGATIGKTSITMFEATTNQACCVISSSKVLNIDFSFYWFLANKQNVINLSVGGGQPNISQEIIRNLKIPVPPLIEQNLITAYIKEKVSLIDKEIQSTEKEITLLKEYRQSLITEAVTGKIDVRDYPLI